MASSGATVTAIGPQALILLAQCPLDAAEQGPIGNFDGDGASGFRRSDGILCI